MATATKADAPHLTTAPAPVPLVAHAVDPGARVGTVPARDPRLARCIRGGVTLVTVSAFALLVLSRRGALARSLARLGHSHWTWVPVAIGLELTSMAAFALMQGRLLRAGGKRLGHRPMMATILAANALSVSVPVAGPELGTAFTFRR
jgi:putative heme transporter